MAKYTQHKLKCGQCGLHFIVCSDYPNWPSPIVTEQDEASADAAKLPPFCPECGQSLRVSGGSLAWVEEVEGFIFEAVPGKARLAGVSQEEWDKVMRPGGRSG